jgi:hypothetical protein
MDPTLLVFDFIQHGVRRFRTTFEGTAEDDLELNGSRAATRSAGTKFTNSAAFLSLLGIVFISAAALMRSAGVVHGATSMQRESPALRGCLKSHSCPSKAVEQKAG